MTDQIDRYTRRELAPQEARDLAQKSLADPELFEDLTASALAMAAVASTRSDSKVVRFPRRRFIAAGVAAAAAVAAVSFYLVRMNRPPSAIRPALAASAKPGQPILLASGLEPERDASQVFRSAEPDSRAPRPAGSIVSIADGMATIDLGSLDGLAEGTDLQVFRSGQSVGHLAAATIFRDRARARILSGSNIKIHDQVQPPADLYLDALLQQVDAGSGRGDLDGARKIAEKAVEWSESANVSPVQKGKALEKLAGLEYRAGSLEDAEKHYRMALSTPASLAAANNLAVLSMLRGDYDGAEASLNRVASTAPRTDIPYVQSLNNLGVLAELRGQRQKAKDLYTQALRASATPEPALETNLARVRSAR